MDTARRRDQWYHTARVCGLLQNLLAAWCSGLPAKPESHFHPEGESVYREPEIEHAPPPTPAQREMLRGLFGGQGSGNRGQESALPPNP
jgi:hypothetical protein